MALSGGKAGSTVSGKIPASMQHASSGRRINTSLLAEVLRTPFALSRITRRGYEKDSEEHSQHAAVAVKVWRLIPDDRKKAGRQK
ncbi:hypothetical protein [Kluyvera ascorbata]|uniref:hypothetical protein n=1 Tax=Kluyvera ascorbata TaxID=51288 RepID=UPI003562A650